MEDSDEPEDGEMLPDGTVHYRANATKEQKESAMNKQMVIGMVEKLVKQSSSSSVCESSTRRGHKRQRRESSDDEHRGDHKRQRTDEHRGGSLRSSVESENEWIDSKIESTDDYERITRYFV